MSYVYKNREYESIEDFASAYGVDEEEARFLYDNDWSLDDIARKKLGHVGGKVFNNEDKYDVDRDVIIVEGNEFGSVEEAREHYGVSKEEFYDRLFSGWTIYACLGIGKTLGSFYNTPFGLYHDGKLYKSFTDLAKLLDTSVPTLKYRIGSNWSADELLNLEGRGKHRRVGGGLSKPVEYKGDRYDSMTEICAELGLVYQKFRDALNSGKSVAEAVELSRFRKR